MHFALVFAALGGVAASAATNSLAVASWGEGNMDVFGVASSGSIWHKYYRGGNEFEPSGGKFEDMNISPAAEYEPTAVSMGKGTMHLLWVDKDGKVYLKFWDGSNWSKIESHGGNFTGPVAATSAGKRLDIVGIDADGHYFHQAWTGSSWYPEVDKWEVLEETWLSPPAAVAYRQNSLRVFGIAEDESLQCAILQQYDDGNWGWEYSGPISEGPYTGRVYAVPWRNATTPEQPEDDDEEFRGVVLMKYEPKAKLFAGYYMPEIKGQVLHLWTGTPAMAVSWPETFQAVGVTIGDLENPGNPNPLTTFQYRVGGDAVYPIVGDETSFLFAETAPVSIISVRPNQYNTFAVDTDGKLRMQIWDGSQFLPDKNSYYDLGDTTKISSQPASDGEHDDQEVLDRSGL